MQDFHLPLNFALSSQSLSVRPPDGLVYARRRAHRCGRVAVASFGIHTVALVPEAGVQQAVVSSSGDAGSTRRGAGRQHAGG